MKKFVFFSCIILCFASVKAQETITVNDKTLQLKTEIDGKLDLLWNIIDGEYRYFIRTSNATITELKNTKGQNNKYQEEYKTTLKEAIGGVDLSTEHVKLTLASLVEFIDNYNKLTDTDFISTHPKSSLEFRLGLFGGLTNSPFVENTENTKTLLAGAELELFQGNSTKRHSGFLQFRQVFDNDDFSYSTTELSLGYRFRVVNSSRFSLYGDVKFATVNFTKVTVTQINNGSEPTIDHISDTVFDVPFIFGIGADIKISECSYITLGYNQLFALLIDHQDNFSTDVTVGYKFKL